MDNPPPESSPAALPIAAAPRPMPWYDWRRLGFNFLTVSILAHLLFGLVAAYFVVQVITPKKKSAFAPGPAGASAPTHALEHKVQMQKRQQSMSAPAAVKRVVTTGMSAVALPAMPAMKTNGPVSPAALGGMGGSGAALGGFGGGAGAGGGGGLNVFGSRTATPGLVGTFYDLKQTGGRQPTNMTPELYTQKVIEFARGGFNAGLLAPYYKSSRPIYATHIFTPSVKADLGPAAFGEEKEVQPRLWLVHYKGVVIPPESGTYRFAGVGDDVLLVRFNGKNVLDACWTIDTKLVQGQTTYPWDWSSPAKGCTLGPRVNVEAGQAYPMEVLIGEQYGGYSGAALTIQQEGKSYQKDPKGANKLPYFRLTNSTELPPPPPSDGRSGYAPYTDDAPAWKAQAARLETSIFSH